MANAKKAQQAVLKAARKAGVQGDPTIYAARLDAYRVTLNKVLVGVMMIAREAGRGGFRDDANKLSRITSQLAESYDQLKVIIDDLDNKS